MAETADFLMPLAPDRAAAPAGGRVRLQTLVIIRWLAIAGQGMTVLFVGYALEFALPVLWVAVPIVASALVNVAVSLRYPASRRLTERGAALSLGYDLVQLAVLLYLTGGLTNPFCVLFLVPVTISATILTLRSTVLLGALALGLVGGLTFFHLPLPWGGTPFELPSLYQFGIWAALSLGMTFLGGYVWRVAQETRRMSDALAAAQMALAREQRLSALDGLAAAAAHELGTPLGTITLVAKELARDLAADSPIAEDIGLLNSQAERCREILGRLARDLRDDAAAGPAPFPVVVETALISLTRGSIEVEVRTAPENRAMPPPTVPRSPEIIHGLGNLIQNAVDFAARKVVLTLYWDARTVGIEIVDDGPGIPSDVLGALGNPYVTTRPDQGGMGLGVFIAMTLLERTGARIVFTNRTEAARVLGASVAIGWPRDVLVSRIATQEAEDDRFIADRGADIAAGR